VTPIRQYNKDDNYYFLDYTLFENGHPEYIEELNKRGELPHPKFKGYPRWIRQDFMTSYELMSHLNRVLTHPYPHRYESIKIHPDEQLSEIVSIGEKTNEDGEKEYFRIWKHEKGYDDGEKITFREFKFGSSYEHISKRHKSGEYPFTSIYS